MKKRIVSFIISLLMVFNISIFYPQVALADASTFAYQDALIPIEAFATAIAIGSGIVASQSQAAIDGASEMLRKAVTSMKAKACLDSETEFRVIDGGKPRKPQKGDDKNNKKWFTIGAGAIATGSLIAGLKASREMMQEIYDNTGYSPMLYTQGIIDLSDVYKISSWQYTYNQMNNDARSLARQMDNIKSTMEQKGYNVNDYFYLGYGADVSSSTVNVPNIHLFAYKKNVGSYSILKYNPSLFYNRYADNSVKYNYYTTDYGDIGSYYNDLDLIQSIKRLDIMAYAYNPTTGKPNVSISETNSSTLSYPRSNYPIYGFYPFAAKQYGFTNKVYNPSQNQNLNFPDWLQQSIETLNGKLAGLNLAISNLQLPQTWGDTQTNIQTGTAPANVINQYINYASNPETAPDPGENPEPDPEPNPQPTPEPAPTEDYLRNFMLPATITEKFPFCVPFDIAKCLKLFSVSGRVAPKWEGTIKYGSKGENEYKVTIDLKDFEPIAKIVRPLEFIVFLVGLIIVTRDLIKG